LQKTFILLIKNKIIKKILEIILVGHQAYNVSALNKC